MLRFGSRGGEAEVPKWLTVAFGVFLIFASPLGLLRAQTLTTPFETKGSLRKSPSESYYTHFAKFYDGDYQEAMREFQAESRASIKTAESRWIDSICYETMLGECYFQTGQLKDALEHYTAALTLFRNFSGWMTKVEFSAIRPAAAGAYKPVPWGTSTRQVQLATYPSSEKLLQGQIDQTVIVTQTGGVVQQANMCLVSPQEIVRCTTLAMRRRAMLLGPVCKHDPLTSELVNAMTRPVGPPNHWSECWVNLERGLMQAAIGQESQAVDLLQRSVLAGGQFDHPLTSVALLELGRHALGRSEYDKAAKLFEEASYAAVNYPDYGVLDEAFRYALVTHFLANRKGLFPPLETALPWAKLKNLRQLRSSLLSCAAENFSVMGETAQAAAMLDEARATIGKRKMGMGWLGARLGYLGAQVLYQQKKIKEGDVALATVMDYMRHGSLRLFHIGLADEMYVRGAVTQRAVVELFADVLRDPQPADWALDPQESLAVMVTPHPLPLEHWFEAAFQRKDYEGAIDVADRARRHRFFTSLDLGGRLESLRWLLESPLESLPQPAQLQRQDIFSRYPAYDQLSRQSRSLRAKIAETPLVIEDATEMRDQGRKLTELADISRQQEVILREIAVRREPATVVFPPLRSVAEVQKSLPNKQAVLAFFVTGGHWYGFLFSNDRVTGWEISSTAALSKQITAMFRDIGQLQQNHELPTKDLTDNKWKHGATQLLETLLKGSPVDFSRPFDELVIVPDGLLWYLPFEALQVTIDGKPQSLISRFRIRYVPTVSLATSTGLGRKQGGNIAVVVGKLYPHDEDAVARAAFERFAKVVPGAVALRSPPPAATSIYRVLFQGLVVLDDLNIPEHSPYGWTPVPIERGNKVGSTLADWLPLPWGGPDVIILPGYHTAAEDGLKRLNLGRPTTGNDRTPSRERASGNDRTPANDRISSNDRIPGNEMFLSVCGLMANGARTLLLSRWRAGGQTSFDLVREFAQDISQSSPADAWQRAVAMTVDTRLNLDAEPRVKREPIDEPPKTSHPFFWAGYMLIDSGTTPEGSEPAAGGPQGNVKQVDKPAEKENLKEGEKPAEATAPADGKGVRKSRQKPAAKSAPKSPAKTMPQDE